MPIGRRLSLRGLMMLVALIAVALGIGLQIRQSNECRLLRDQNERLQEELAAAKFDLQLEKIAFQLKVPTEALYHDCMPRGELNRIRWEALDQCGAADNFDPLYYVLSHLRSSPSLQLVHGSRRSDDWKVLQDSFWEGYAINHADDGAQLLVGHLRHVAEFRERVMADPELVNEFLKPLLLRLVRCTDARSRYQAIEAFLLLDELPAEAVDVLRQSLNRGENLPPGSSRADRIKFYSFDPEEARRLIEEYHLADKVAAGAQDKTLAQ